TMRGGHLALFVNASREKAGLAQVPNRFVSAIGFEQASRFLPTTVERDILETRHAIKSAINATYCCSHFATESRSQIVDRPSRKTATGLGVLQHFFDGRVAIENAA